MAFIVFEGLDACGKSTQIQRLEQKLKEKGIESVLTREPGGTEVGEELRNLLLRIQDQPPNSRAELLIYEACRAQLVEKVIEPALEKGQWVLSDRYFGSSVAFQAGGRGLDRLAVDQLNEFATGGLKADLTILVDISVETSQQRKGVRAEQGQELDRFEIEKIEFHRRIYQSYQEQAEADDWVKVNGEKSIDEVADRIWSIIERQKWLES